MRILRFPRVSLFLIVSIIQAGGVFADGLDNWHGGTNLAGNANFSDFVYLNNFYVAIAPDPAFYLTGGTNIYSSTDGTNWIIRQTGDNGLRAVAYGNGVYVAAGGPDGAAIYHSANGIDWVQVPPMNTTSIEALNRVIYVNGRFLGVGANFLSAPGTIATSPDGANWSSQASGTYTFLTDVVWANGAYYAVGNYMNYQPGDTNTTIITSPDGTNWNTLGTYTNVITRFAFANGLFVGVGGAFVYNSTNGATWSRVYNAGANLDAIAQGGNRFVAVGAAGTIITSTNGVNWQHRSSGVASELQSVALTGQTWVAVGKNSTVIHSDAIADAPPPPPPLTPAPRLTMQFSRDFSNRVSVSVNSTDDAAFGQSYYLQYSTDLLSWSNVADFLYLVPSTIYNETTASSIQRRYFRVLNQ